MVEKTFLENLTLKRFIAFESTGFLSIILQALEIVWSIIKHLIPTRE